MLGTTPYSPSNGTNPFVRLMVLLVVYAGASLPISGVHVVNTTPYSPSNGTNPFVRLMVLLVVYAGASLPISGGVGALSLSLGYMW